MVPEESTSDGSSRVNEAVEKSSDDEKYVVDLGLRYTPPTTLNMEVKCDDNEEEEEEVWKKRDSYKLKTFRKEIKNNKVSNIETTDCHKNPINVLNEDKNDSEDITDMNADRSVYYKSYIIIGR